MTRTELLSIGEFAQQAALTPRALRHYDDLGLLSPAHVNRDTGYRYYDASQLLVAARIRRLRDIGLPLEVIGDVVHSLDDWPLLRSLLIDHRGTVAAAATREHERLAAIDQWLEDGPTTSTENVSIIEQPSEPVATFRWTGTAEGLEQGPIELADWITLYTALGEHQITPVGMIGIANHYDHNGHVDLDVGFVTDHLAPPSEHYASRVLDGGTMASLTYNGIANKAAAYEALEIWLLANDQRRRGPSRERSDIPWTHLTADTATTPAALDQQAWPVQIQVPIAPAI